MSDTKSNPPDENTGKLPPSDDSDRQAAETQSEESEEQMMTSDGDTGAAIAASNATVTRGSDEYATSGSEGAAGNKETGS